MPMDGDGNGDDLKGRKGINMMLVIWIHAFCATLVMIARWFARWNLADTSKHGAVNMTFATISWVSALSMIIRGLRTVDLFVPNLGSWPCFPDSALH